MQHYFEGLPDDDSGGELMAYLRNLPLSIIAPKLDILKTLVGGLVKQGMKILVFYHYQNTGQKIVDVLKEMGFFVFGNRWLTDPFRVCVASNAWIMNIQIRSHMIHRQQKHPIGIECACFDGSVDECQGKRL